MRGVDRRWWDARTLGDARRSIPKRRSVAWRLFAVRALTEGWENVTATENDPALSAPDTLARILQQGEKQAIQKQCE